MSLPVHDLSSHADPAWRDIEQLVAQIDALSKSSMGIPAFSRELVDRSVRALEAVGGAVWLKKQGNLRPVYETHLWSAAGGGDVATHRQLAETVVGHGKTDFLLPDSPASHGNVPSNTTELTLLLSPIQVERNVVGVIELGQRPADASVHRGQLRLLAVLSELTAQYLTRDELLRLRRNDSMWQQFRRFTSDVHRSLDLRETAYRIVNDGRGFVGCDRVSLLAPAGRHLRLLAVSGLDTFDRRANAVKSLEQLAQVVARTNDILRYDGNQLEMAPEIQRQLDHHIDQSHARMLVAVPLRLPELDLEPANDHANSAMVGVLIAECFDTETDLTTGHRLDLMVDQSALALGNALDYQRLPVVRTLHRSGWFSDFWKISKLVGGLLLLASLGAAAMLIQADFDVSVNGELQPEQRREVFAPHDAQVAEFLVQHDDLVQSGQELLTLTNPELELELQRVQGEYETNRKRLWAVESARLQSSPGADAPPAQLAAEQEELKQRLTGYQDQLSLLREELQSLVVRSPIDGRVLTWDVESLLKNRPVQRGQVLLTVGNIDGPWLAELEVPDDRIGYVLSAQQEIDVALDVAFELATQRGTRYQGKVAQIASRTEVNDDGEATVLVTVAFDADSMSELRPGTTISANIRCGRRSLAFVWLHDVIEVVREWFLF